MTVSDKELAWPGLGRPPPRKGPLSRKLRVGEGQLRSKREEDPLDQRRRGFPAGGRGLLEDRKEAISWSRGCSAGFPCRLLGALGERAPWFLSRGRGDEQPAACASRQAAQCSEREAYQQSGAEQTGVSDLEQHPGCIGAQSASREKEGKVLWPILGGGLQHRDAPSSPRGSLSFLMPGEEDASGLLQPRGGDGPSFPAERQQAGHSGERPWAPALLLCCCAGRVSRPASPCWPFPSLPLKP